MPVFRVLFCYCSADTLRCLFFFILLFVWSLFLMLFLFFIPLFVPVAQVIDKRGMDPKLKPLLAQFHVEIQARHLVSSCPGSGLGACSRSGQALDLTICLCKPATLSPSVKYIRGSSSDLPRNALACSLIFLFLTLGIRRHEATQ